MIHETPLVSIIIPCFNGSETIIDAISSARSQAYPQVEVIVVDDGSTDGSYDLVKNHIDGLPAVKLFRQSNSGPSKARNYGFLNSGGKFVMFLDADDLIHADYVNECMTVYNNLPDLEIVYSGARYFGARKGKWRLAHFRMDTLLFKNSIPIFPLIRASTFRDVGMFDEALTYAEDWELWIRVVSRYGPKVYQLKQSLYYYRKSDTKASLTTMRYMGEGWDEALLYIYKKHYALYKADNGSIFELFDGRRYRRKYLDEWYRKLFYKLIKPKKYREMYRDRVDV